VFTSRLKESTFPGLVQCSDSAFVLGDDDTQ
jgi:hypothetical protein